MCSEGFFLDNDEMADGYRRCLAAIDKKPIMFWFYMMIPAY